MTTPADSFLHIEKGHAEPEEIAALTVVLLMATAAGQPETSPAPDTATPWRRREREAQFPSPHSWRSATGFA